MKNAWKSGAIQSQPSAVGYVEGYPTEGSSTSGTDATVPGAYWYHMVTQEIQNAIVGGGITPDLSSLDQLNLSIDARIKKLNDLIDAVDNRLSTLDIVPTGTVFSFATASPPSDQWLICDGRAVSRTTYAALFGVIGTSCGTGDGQTTFNLPNAIGKVLWGATSGIGQSISAGLPNLTGKFYAIDYGRNGFEGAFFKIGEYNEDIRTGSSKKGVIAGLSASRSNSIYGSSSTVQPPAIKVLPCIHI